MSYKLQKPYTDIQRADFVCEYQGLNYYEDDNCIIMYSDSESVTNGVVTDISETPEYIAEQNKKSIQQAKVVRDKVIDAVTSSVILDQLQKENGRISQEVYNARFLAKANMVKTAEEEFYTTTGLTTPTSIGV